MLISKASKRLYYLRKLDQFKIDKKLTTLFYKSVIGSIISFCITAWGGNCLKKDMVKIERLIKIASRYTNDIRTLEETITLMTKTKIINIVDDHTHPLNRLVIKSSRSDRYLSIRTKTNRHLKSFLPTGVRMLNMYM